MSSSERTRLEPGYRLDRYELLCPIAHGGMASVWLARMHGKHGFEKLVAIKTILPQFATDLRFQRMFLDEARIASGIEHANVAHILDLGEEHDVLYLVMEWVDGDSLSKLHRAAERRAARIPLGVVLRILADTCAGLHVAHELTDKIGNPLEVVHRDISPQNILVSSRGNAKLIDFGIAKARDRVSGDTNTGLLKGKVQYMAPEQAVGGAIDRRADVWAIGSVLYYLLTGVAPYDGPNQLATLHMLTKGAPPAPLPAHIPAAVNALATRAMAHDPQKRIGNAADLQRQLEILMVQCNVYTTTVDVASYVAHQLHERAEARRRAVALALEAAADRERIQKLLKPASLDSSTGMMRLAEESRPAAREVVGLNDSGQNPHYGQNAHYAAGADAFNASSASVNLIADDADEASAPTRELAYDAVAAHGPNARAAAYAPPPTLGGDPLGAVAHPLGESEQPSMNGATLGAAAVTFPVRFAKIPAGKRQLLAAAFGVGAALLLVGAIATLASVIGKPQNAASGTDSSRVTPRASSIPSIAAASPATVSHARLETGVIGNVYADPSVSAATPSSTAAHPDAPRPVGSASEHRVPTGALTTRATSPLLTPTTAATSSTRKTKTPDGF